MSLSSGKEGREHFFMWIRHIDFKVKEGNSNRRGKRCHAALLDQRTPDKGSKGVGLAGLEVRGQN